ncbi:MAG: hypothetical protein KDD35_04830 [Bdellovibrionales bacterium]|nr:hypothetical protein [Bdellovibrionales bacterium]
MNTADNSTNEVFSYHLVKLDFFSAIRFFIFPPHSNTVSGLKYSLCLFTMKPGISVFSFARYNFTTLALIAWWEHADWLDRFLESGKYPLSPSESWHIRIKPYRRWGSLKELNHAHLFKELMSPSGTVSARPLAKFNLSKT